MVNLEEYEKLLKKANKELTLSAKLGDEALEAFVFVGTGTVVMVVGLLVLRAGMHAIDRSYGLDLNKLYSSSEYSV